MNINYDNVSNFGREGGGEGGGGEGGRGEGGRGEGGGVRGGGGEGGRGEGGGGEGGDLDKTIYLLACPISPIIMRLLTDAPQAIWII